MSIKQGNVKVTVHHVDRKTFDNLVKEHSRGLRVFALTFFNNPQGMAVDDLLQETWLRAWRFKDNIRDLSTVRSWLITILKRENARQWDNVYSDIKYLTYGNDSTEEAIEADITDEIFIEKVLDKLPRLKAEMAILRLQGYTNEQVSKHYGIPLNTVGVRFKRIIDSISDGSIWM